MTRTPAETLALVRAALDTLPKNAEGIPMLVNDPLMTTRPGRDGGDLPTLTPREDRALDAIRKHRCDVCRAPLLLVEIGPHYRTLHPNDAPRVSPIA